MTDDWKQQMEDAAARAARATDAELAEAMASLRGLDGAALAALKPSVALADHAAFDALANAVQEATARNEDTAALVSRVRALGEDAVRLAGKVARLASGLPG